MRTPLDILNDIMNEHPCGGCTACCTVMGVSELGKPYYTPCPKLIPIGCGIHAERPTSCREFECAWRVGLVPGGNTARPDRLGIMFYFESEGDNDFVDVYELAEGALARVPVAKLVEAIAARFGGVTGVRYYPVNSRIGVNFELSADYIDQSNLVGRSRFFRHDGRNYYFVEEPHAES